MDAELQTAIVAIVKAALSRVMGACLKDPEAYGPPPRTTFLVRHHYRTPPPVPAPWEEDSDSPLVQRINSDQHHRYGDREWRTPPDLVSLPLAEAWQLSPSGLQSVDPLTVVPPTHRSASTNGQPFSIRMVYQEPVVHFTVTPDQAEVYIDAQWAPLWGTGETLEIVRSPSGVTLVDRMTRWTS